MGWNYDDWKTGLNESWSPMNQAENESEEEDEAVQELNVREGDEITVQIGSSLVSGKVDGFEDEITLFIDEKGMERWCIDCQIKTINGVPV